MIAKKWVPKMFAILSGIAFIFLLVVALPIGESNLWQEMKSLWNTQGAIGFAAQAIGVAILGLLAIGVLWAVTKVISDHKGKIYFVVSLVVIFFLVFALSDVKSEMRKTKEENIALRGVIDDLNGEKNLVALAQSAPGWAGAYILALIAAAVIPFSGNRLAGRARGGGALISVFSILLGAAVLLLGEYALMRARINMAVVTAAVGNLPKIKEYLLAAPSLPLAKAVFGRTIGLALGGFNFALMLIPFVAGLFGRLFGGGDEY